MAGGRALSIEAGLAMPILLSHALAALLFTGVALSRLHERATGLPRVTFIAALLATALWALSIAGIDQSDGIPRVAESLRNLAWLGFMYALVRRDPRTPEHRAVAILYGIVALLVLVNAGLAMVWIGSGGAMLPEIATLRLVLHMMAAISAIVLVHHLYTAAAPGTRGGIRLVVLALAAMWGSDLLLYGAAWLEADIPGQIVVARGIVMVVAAPALLIAVTRNGDWTLHLSRTIAWQTLSFAAVVLYAAAMVAATSIIALVSGHDARLWQTAFVVGSTATGLAFLASPRVRAWTKVKVAKHLFRHRYDYRSEWIRFTDTLGKPDDAAPLDQRIVKAVADLTDSPAGLLLVPESAGPGGGLGVGLDWNWDLPSGSAPAALAQYLVDTGRIVELDTVRSSATDAVEAAAIPRWMLEGDGWAIVPLAHLGRLQGAILLARPPIDRALDWEDFDLLRIAGRHVASYLAEARAQEALAEAQRFDEFNRRFAFILHDVKNLVSQLTLVARNAERHADNPDFRVDMVATLKDSAGRMNDLLARLSQHHRARADTLQPVALRDVLERVARTRRAYHPVTVSGDPALLAQADPARLEQVLAHLLQNAIEASPADAPVALSLTVDGGHATVIVEDHGCGMTPAFLRDQLFKPFASSKPAGFGIGAFEAKQLAEAMGGHVTVASQPGHGTRFCVHLPQARSLDAAA
ncbi:XrtA/PEP-CTERM system histidine kinase PrsK [Sphingomonas sp. PAMC 26617]|uniref:XrtA/PEP-CTERM system histidine kinase PrsK n=1 Tax=Sphingomonas sp. PAMC 26617 TaxID=1112216 RepID=UPI000288A72B|nr:XrtA/PEP-CTERM system histidine kinase PrsK [Sphingomonas sp. PAMC 26617]